MENPSLTSKVRIQVYVPKEWVPKIEKYMKKKGYWTASEMIRDLIREHIIEGDN